jgi:CheY-like chemotaxis protein
MWDSRIVREVLSWFHVCIGLLQAVCGVSGVKPYNSARFHVWAKPMARSLPGGQRRRVNFIYKDIVMARIATLRLLVADDHAIVRDSITALLIRAGFEVIAEASDGIEAVRLTAELLPDIAVLDVSMPRLNGIDATREITRCLPGCKVILLTMHDADAFAVASIRAGASGYLSKAQAFSCLLEAIDALQNGRTYFSPMAHVSRVEPYVPHQ